MAIQHEVAQLLDAYDELEAAAVKELMAKEAAKAAIMPDLLLGRVRVPA